MNERIFELAKQADDYADTYCDTIALSYSNWNAIRDTNFAELIVQECMEQVRGEYLPVLEDKEMMKDTHWDGYVQCGVDSYVAIREHFYGVEE